MGEFERGKGGGVGVGECWKGEWRNVLTFSCQKVYQHLPNCPWALRLIRDLSVVKDVFHEH